MAARSPRFEAARDPLWTWLALGAALAAAAFLRLHALGAPGLWTDELVSWWASSADSVPDLLRRSGTCMATPPLSFLAERTSLALLGRSAWALRLPSALAGIAGVGVVFLAGRRMFGAEAGVLAALLLAVHPFHVAFSTEARPYAYALLLATLSLWAFSELMLRPGRRFLLLYVLASALLLYTQFVFLPLLLAQAAAYALQRSRRLATPLAPVWAAAAMGAVLVLALPLLPQILSVGHRASSLAWPAAEEYPPWLHWFFQTSPLAAALLIGLVVVCARRSDAVPPDEREPALRERFDATLLALACVLPSILLGVAAVALRLPSLAKPRYGSAYLGACALLVGFLLTRPFWRSARRLTAGSYLFLIVLTQVLPPLASGRSFNVDAEAERWGEIGAILDGERRAGDLVLFRSPLVESAELFRGTLPARCAGYVASPLGDFYLRDQTGITLLPPAFEGPPYPRSYGPLLGAPLAGRTRVWLVMAGAPDPEGYLGAVLSFAAAVTGRSFEVESVRSFGVVSVALLRAGS